MEDVTKELPLGRVGSLFHHKFLSIGFLGRQRVEMNILKEAHKPAFNLDTERHTGQLE